MKEKHTFPKGFLWGVATASYQVEGGIENCDWAQAAREGRVPECGRACDHYNKYEEDFDIAKSLGHNAHRFSVEWARIEPEEGKFDREAIEHYRKVIAALKERNMEPILTLWHFTLPQWFADSGGFERPDAPEVFARYAEHVAKELGAEVTKITTMNEPMVFAGLGWVKGNWPPFKMWSPMTVIEWTNSGDRRKSRPKKNFLAPFVYRKVVKNLLRTHRVTYTALKKINPAFDVSFVKHVVAYDANNNIFNRFRAYIEDKIFNQTFLRPAAKYTDSIGLNFYHYVKFGDRPEYKKSDMGWEMAPEGIYNAIMLLWKFKKPIFISEAGVADHDDSDRAEYITKQVAATGRAIQDGADVRGHMYWSFLDNYEWALGYDKRFGLVEVNYDTLERTIRPSAYVYKEICESNSIEL